MLNNMTKQKRIVLLIDDEAVIREVGCEMVESLGWLCITAESGEQGIQLYEENKENIRLVILDVELPDISGEKVYEILRKKNPGIKVLLSSGYGREYLESRFFKQRMEHFIPKPFQLKKLSHKINQLIRE